LNSISEPEANLGKRGGHFDANTDFVFRRSSKLTKTRKKRSKQTSHVRQKKIIAREQSRSQVALTNQYAGKASPALRILGVDELAILFRCSTEKVKRLARAREIPAFKIGKSWFVREQDLERHIDHVLASP
jgi:excisionase family DNA binding protein